MHDHVHSHDSSSSGSPSLEPEVNGCGMTDLIATRKSAAAEA
jgi:hypothetical protein